MRARVRAAVVAAVVTTTGMLGACSIDIPGGGGDGFRILAGSEIEDLEPLLEDAEDVIGTSITVDYSGTLSGAEQIAGGAAAGSYQASWFSSNRYLQLLPGASDQIRDSRQIMTSPVIIGVRQSKAAELGWDDRAPSWGDIAEAAESGDFTFAMTNPASSNTGFSALIGVATALSGTGDALTTGDIDRVSTDLQGFFSGQTLTAGSSGWLADAFVERQGDPARQIDGLVNYESVLAALNAEGATDEPLTLIYPSDGTVTADYPLTLLAPGEESDGAEDEERYDKLVAWLLEPDQQRRIVELTKRRPVATGVEPDPALSSSLIVDLPFPNQLAVATDLISAYLNEIRRPAQTIFVLDTSGSMEGDRIADLRTSLTGLAGADTSSQGTFARFRNRERVTLIPFDTVPEAPKTFEVPETDPEPVLQQISAVANGLVADGDTAIYDSMIEAYSVAQRQVEENPDSFTSIVLMTDGEWTFGRGPGDFQSYYEDLPDEVRAVPTFTILFGDSSVEEMTEIADTTGGRVFDARAGELSTAFQEIRGYQ